MNAVERGALCREMVSDRRRMGLDLASVRRIDGVLGDRWQIQPPVHPEHWEERLQKLAGKRLANKFFELHDEQCVYFQDEVSPPVELETAFYDLIANPRISGHVHSQKRTVILDESCLLVFLAKALRVTGPVLDVGCHIGYHAAVLTSETALDIHGIDLSREAIRVAKEKAAGHPKLSFSDMALECDEFLERFEMVYAFHSLEFNAATANRLSRVLKPGGVAVIVPTHETDGDNELAAALLGCGLGWGLEDIVGGWCGEGRSQEAAFASVFVKGDSTPIPQTANETIASYWERYFGSYAQDPERPKPERNQSYFRGHWLAGSGRTTLPG